MIPALSLAALLALPPAANAQVRVTALLGATGSSTLINDFVVQPFTLKPGLAPTFLVSGSLPVSPTLRVSLDLGYGSSTLELTEEDGATQDFGTLGTFTAALALVGPIFSKLDWRLSLGLLKYLPSEATGVFADGVPLAADFGIGLDWRQPLSTRWTGVVGVRYDMHLFSTPALTAAGFSGSQQVSRLGLAVGAAWDFQ